jgi:amidase
MESLVFSTATSLAAAIRTKEVSSREVVDAHLAQIERHNGALNAVVTLDADGARARAAEADAATARGESWGPLHGVPMTIKDSLQTAGMRTTSGFPPLADFVPTQDATAVARVRSAGAVILGKTNLPPLAGDYQTTNPIFGTTNNPWNLGRGVGGSSGGSAAAVASGMTPLDLGSDIGGSVRIPAHYCGVCSIKPTDSRVPLTGHIPGMPGQPLTVRHQGTIGPLARSVDDLALALQLISGPDGRTWETPPAPTGGMPVRRFEGLRLAWACDVSGVRAGAAVSTGVASAVARLAARGARVEEAAPPGFDLLDALYGMGFLFGAEVGAGMPVEQALAQRPGPKAVDPASRGIYDGTECSYRAYSDVLVRRDSYIAAIEAFLDQFDAWLLPVSLTPAIAHCRGGTPIDVDGTKVPYMLAGLGYTAPFNFTGQPVAVVPVGLSPEGLPIGVQLVGKRWADMDILAVARLVEEACGGVRRPPGY